MKNINEGLRVLDELIRNVYKLISPISVHDDLQWLLNKSYRTQHFDKYPHCWKSLHKKGRELPFFPVCNRTGMEDPAIIDKSLIIANKMKDRPDIDQDKLLITLKGLDSLKRRLSKPIPKPAFDAAKKAKVTIGMKKISQYLKDLR